MYHLSQCAILTLSFTPLRTDFGQPEELEKLGGTSDKQLRKSLVGKWNLTTPHTNLLLQYEVLVLMILHKHYHTFPPFAFIDTNSKRWAPIERRGITVHISIMIRLTALIQYLTKLGTFNVQKLYIFVRLTLIEMIPHSSVPLNNQYLF